MARLGQLGGAVSPLPPGDALLEARVVRSIRAGARVIVLLTDEDDRAAAVGEAIAERLGRTMHTWSVAAGVDRGGRERELGGLLSRLHADGGDDELWVMFEALRELRGEAQRRLLRELAQARRGPSVLLVESASSELPDIPELELERLPLPDFELLRERVLQVADALDHERPALAESLEDAVDVVAHAGIGLSLDRFDRSIADAIASANSTAASVAAALASRRVATACGNVLERVDSDHDEALIGFGRFLDWTHERAPCFAPGADAAGLRRGRGVGLLGAPGCGLGLAVRVGARRLGLPLVRVAPASSASVGSILTALERAAPVGLYVDESVPEQLVALLSSWLATHDRGVFLFLVLTRPRPSLPGLDALFFADLPSPERRAELLASMLTRPTASGRPVIFGGPLDRWLELARAAAGCSADDLFEALTRARLCGLARRRPASAEDFEVALAERPPLAEREPHELEALRRWATSIAVDVESPVRER